MARPKKPVFGVYRLILENHQALMSAVFNIYNSVSISQSNTVGRDPTLERLARQAEATKRALDEGLRSPPTPSRIARTARRDVAESYGASCLRDVAEG